MIVSMKLTQREQEIVALLRTNPLLNSDALATRLETTRAAINVHLSNLGKKGVILGRGYMLADQPGVVVIGGANMDIKARSFTPAVGATSNPGATRFTPGGVGRNIAENLSRLGTRTHLITAIGNDSLGDTLLRETSDAGVDVTHVLRANTTTGTYTAVLDTNGELVISVADMAASAELLPQHVDRARDLIAGADLVVLDGNLAGPTMSFAVGLATNAAARIIIEPVSVAKGAALAAVPGVIDIDHPLYLITPNRDELAAMTNLPATTASEIQAAVTQLHSRGIENVWVRLGATGSIISGPQGTSHLPAFATDVVDVTGAGDSLLAGFCHALLQGADITDAARFGHATATLTIASPETVRRDLTEQLVTRTLAGAQSLDLQPLTT